MKHCTQLATLPKNPGFVQVNCPITWRVSARLADVSPMWSKPCFKINYDYLEKVSARIAVVKFQPGLGQPGSRLTGLKISHVIVFSPG